VVVIASVGSVEEAAIVGEMDGACSYLAAETFRRQGVDL